MGEEGEVVVEEAVAVAEEHTVVAAIEAAEEGTIRLICVKSSTYVVVNFACL